MIPDFQTVMLPLLEWAKDGSAHSIKDAIDVLADRFRLTPEERAELLPSGRQRRFSNRVHWARQFLKSALLVERVAHGQFRITERGKKLLATKPNAITMKLLEQYPEYRVFRGKSADRKKTATTGEQAAESEAVRTPEEEIEEAVQAIRQKLADEVLERLGSSKPEFFEHVVLDLLEKMGYGGFRSGAGVPLGGPNDRGIDGVIHQDRLELESVYVQAKKWSKAVDSSEIRDFAGALQIAKASKGVFMTTSTFSKPAREQADKVPAKIILIDGKRLAQLMIDHDVGIIPIKTYTLKRVDADYFTDEE